MTFKCCKCKEQNEKEQCNVCVSCFVNLETQIKEIKRQEEFEYLIKSIKEELNELTLFIKNKKKNKSHNYSIRRLTKKDKEYIRTKFNNECALCNRFFDRKYMHIDHIKPVSKGGTNSIENLRLLCVECNLKKSDYFKEKV